MLWSLKLLFVSFMLVNFNNEMLISTKEIESFNQNELLVNLLSSVNELSKQILKQEEKLEVIGEKLSVLEKSNPNSKETSKVNKIYDEHFNCIENCSISSSTRAVLPTSCEEAMYGLQERIYLMSIRDSALQPFYAYCIYRDLKKWTVIQRRKNGAVNFYRGWEDYKNGFGDLYGEYWLGLERLHQMTIKQNYELLIQLEDYGGKSATITYSNFTVGSEYLYYMLLVDNKKKDGFTVHSGLYFSTYDNYNDIFYINLAEKRMSAWWGFSRYTDLNGPYMSYSNMKTKPSMYWYNNYNGGFTSDTLKFTLMAIRPT